MIIKINRDKMSMNIKGQNMIEYERDVDFRTIPLRVSVLDFDLPSTRLLLKSLESADNVVHVVHFQNLKAARSRIESENINTIFIDLLSFGIENSSAFVFEIREALPEIVFVLFHDQERVEQNREEFFHGERRRFSHYYRLDKRTPVDSFDDELAATIRRCQSDLGWRMSERSLQKLLYQSPEKRKISEDASRVQPPNLIGTIDRLAVVREPFIQENMVFVSHRFSEADESFVQGLTRHLADKGFRIITGKLATGYISQAVIRRIKEAEFFLCLLTRSYQKADGTYSASAWLHQELGAAIAFSKPIVLMVEEGVTDLGGLQGDVQRIHFAERGFMNAALDAAEILRAYAGREAS